MMMEKLVLALVGGWNGGEREGERKNYRNRAERLFLANFGPDFLLP
jgi:hypothetical protein